MAPPLAIAPRSATTGLVQCTAARAHTTRALIALVLLPLFSLRTTTIATTVGLSAAYCASAPERQAPQNHLVGMMR